MSAERDLAVAALRDFQAACADVRRILREIESAVTRIVRQLERDEAFVDVMHDNSAPARRQELTNALADLEGSRHRMRLAFVRLGLKQGASIGSLARAWGFSRQLTSRLAQEAGGQTGAEDKS